MKYLLLLIVICGSCATNVYTTKYDCDNLIDAKRPLSFESEQDFLLFLKLPCSWENFFAGDTIMVGGNPTIIIDTY